MSQPPLRGRVALVTGATSGIGLALARLLDQRGLKLVINSASSVDAGQRLAARLGEATYLRADVSDGEQAAALVAGALDRFGRLDVVVNNAGAASEQPIPHADLHAVTDEMWQRVLGVNLLGPWQVTRAAAEALAATGDGAVVNVSSLAGVQVGGSSVPYAVSKAALNHLTRLLADALAPHIRVNAVAPGMTDTPWTAEWGDARERYAESTPLGRIGSAEQVAEACLALLELTHVTGEVLVVDGGRHLR